MEPKQNLLADGLILTPTPQFDHFNLLKDITSFEGIYALAHNNYQLVNLTQNQALDKFKMGSPSFATRPPGRAIYNLPSKEFLDMVFASNLDSQTQHNLTDEG